ncbi:MAG: DUF4143 domain-containing protein, partial [Sedimentisphaerales bacterium]|nr:DUF4143 domain-containing protein [Sedimentisphaerales bacterium]
PALMKNVSESLAGRIALVYMTPFILPEFDAGRMDDLWLCGGYPDGGISNAGLFPLWQKNYLEMLTTRDLPNWGMPAKPQQTIRLLAMLAACHGQAFNASGLGASLSLDYKTIQSYCDFLEGVFLIRRLAPYSANIGKRLIKSPKIYWRDSGLLHSLLNVNNMDQLYNQPWLGHSWEGFIIEQTLSTLAAAGKMVTPYFFRTGDGYELDIVLDWGSELWAIEIKLTSDPSTEMISKLHKTADMINASKRILICRIAEMIENKNLLVTNAVDWTKILQT